MNSSASRNDIASLAPMVKDMLAHLKILNPEYDRKISTLMSAVDCIGVSGKYSNLSSAIHAITEEIISAKKESESKVIERCLALSDSLSKTPENVLSPHQLKNVERFRIALSEPVKSIPRIIEAAQVVTSDMILSIETYKEKAYAGSIVEQKVGDFKSGTSGILQADVALATKRISRDLIKLSGQLIKTKPDCNEVKVITEEINSVMSSKSINFFQCIDLLSRVTWILQNESEKDLVNSKKNLFSLVQKFSGLAEMFDDAVISFGESKSESSNFSSSFQVHLDKLNSIGLNAKNLEQVKSEMFDQVAKMQKDLAEHIKKQNSLIAKQELIIGSQSNKIAEITCHTKEIKEKLDRTISSSSMDSLTGVKNRASFDADVIKLSSLWACGEVKFLSVAMIDLDNFKSINDTHGHLVGDEVLKHVARVISSACGKYNGARCYRFGGEEFALIIESKDPMDIARICKDVHKSVENSLFTSSNKLIQRTVTCSMGVEYFGGNMVANDVISNADKAMYKAKQSGKNRVWVASRKTIEEHIASNNANKLIEIASRSI